jgi:hypothetical protein
MIMEKEKKIYKMNLGMIRTIDFAEKIGQKDDWVFNGQKNDFPEVLITMLYNSALHNNICNKRASMICGDGYIVDKTTNKNLQLTEKFCDNINRYGETIDELIEKIAIDYVVFGSAAIQVVWGRGGNQIAELFHLPMDKLRLGKKDELGHIDKYWYSDNWKLCRREEFEPVALTPFTTIPEIIALAPTQVLLINKYSVGNSYYSQPDYIGGLNYINLDYQTSEFGNSYVKNGYFPNVMVTFKNVSEEDKEFVTNSFKENYQGAANANKVLFNFTEGDNDVKIEPISIQGFEKVIETFDQLATKNILQAHGIPGILVGIAEAGKLSDASEINNAYLTYEASKTAPAQLAIIHKLNKLLKVNNLDEIKITSSTPIPFSADENTMMSVLTVNELREELGFGSLEPAKYGEIVSNASYLRTVGPDANPNQPGAPIAVKPKKQIIKPQVPNQ